MPNILWVAVGATSATSNFLRIAGWNRVLTLPLSCQAVLGSSSYMQSANCALFPPGSKASRARCSPLSFVHCVPSA